MKSSLIMNSGLSLITGLLLYSVSAHALDIANGKALHDEHCRRCHTPDLYVGEKSKITSIDKLRGRVSQCEINLELTWFDDEIDDVTAYLNKEFYKFTEK